MKKLLALAGFIAICCTQVNAQDKKDNVKQDVKEGAKTAGRETKKAAKTVGNKTAEIASKGAARVSDQRYEGKQGPNGETIYIDDNNKYYQIDKKGHKEYIQEDKLKNK